MQPVVICKGARFSPCRVYRYVLWRWWNRDKPYAMFIGLNPSTADETHDDPTIRRCIGFAAGWGYGGLCMANLFAARATDPKKIMKYRDSIGKENDIWLLKLSLKAGVVVAAWGTKGGFQHRDVIICDMLDNLTCLGLTKTGYPRHPLYLSKDTHLRPFDIGTEGELK